MLYQIEDSRPLVFHLSLIDFCGKTFPWSVSLEGMTNYLTILLNVMGDVSFRPSAYHFHLQHTFSLVNLAPGKVVISDSVEVETSWTTSFSL